VPVYCRFRVKADPQADGWFRLPVARCGPLEILTSRLKEAAPRRAAPRRAEESALGAIVLLRLRATENTPPLTTSDKGRKVAEKDLAYFGRKYLRLNII
jgi:hypothetical protein